MKKLEYDLKIRQSYHGNGGKEGYKYKVYDHKGKKVGELKDIPAKCLEGNILSINGIHYVVLSIYDSPNPREERSEVMYYKLKKFECKPDFDLGELINSKR